MRNKTWITILILSMMLFTALPSKAFYVDIDYHYRLNDDNTATLLENMGISSHHHIPSTVEEYTVTQIGEYLFSDMHSISTLIVPETIIHIESNPFSFCSSLQGIKVSPDNPVYAEINGVLFYKPEKKLIAFPPSFPETNYHVPDGTLAIGAGAFANASMLKSVIIPDSVTVIEDSVFMNCTSLESVRLPSQLSTISPFLFYDCHKLNTISIPEDVSTIDEGAFARCFNLSSVSLPRALSSIEYRAFSECYNLTSIHLPSSISSIDTEAFTVFPKLTALTVDKDSYAEQWAKESFIPYDYPNPLWAGHNP